MIVNRICFVIAFIFNITILSRVYATDCALPLDIVTTDIGTGFENRCILRDKYGFLWVGTTNGLNCFDGNGKMVYRPNSEPLLGISNTYVSSLFENDDDILIGTNGGLQVFDRHNNTISQFPYETKYGVTISALVEKIIDTGQGRLWISTQGQGFFIFDKTDNSLVQNSRHGSFYSDITIGANGLIYLASINGHIQAFKPDGEFVSESVLPDYTTDKNGISIASSGTDIWISAGVNLYRMETNTGKISKTPVNANIAATINTILSLPDGSLLLGTNSGPWSYNTITSGIPTRIVADKSTLINPDVRVTALSVDANNDILMVHPTGPIEILTNKSPAFKFVPLHSAPSTYGYDFVRAIAVSNDKTGLWIGSDDGLYFYNLNTESFNKITPPPSIRYQSVSCLVLDNNHLWIGTQSDGIVVYDIADGKWRQFTYNENVPYTILSNEINSIYRTSAGEIYVLTDWGICKYNPAADNFPQLTEFGQQTRGITMQEDSRGGLWIATANNGLYYRAPGEPRFHNEKCSTTGEAIPVTMMLTDRQNRLWAATGNHGLFLYDPDSDEFPPFEISLLNHKSVLFLSTDTVGALYIGANDLLLKLDSNDNITMYNFDRHEEWSPVAGVIETLDNGKNIIGCRNGFLIFDAGKLKSYDDKIRVYPQSLSFPFLDDDSMELERLSLNSLLYTRNAIELPYTNNTFTIRLSATRPFSSPDVRYDYMLEGADKAWITGVSIPEITYNNLPPGNYKFLLRPHGIKDPAISTLSISVLPPWYLTTWAYLVYFLFALLIIGAGAAFIRKILKRKYHRQIQNMQIQKEREVFEAKARYFVDLVHEIRTPLMLISLPLERLAEDETSTQPQTKNNSKTKYIKSMQRNIDYLLGITNQLLDFRRAEKSSEIQLSLSRININRKLRDITRRFDEPMKISGKNINLILPDHDIFATIDEDKTERLLMNLIGNAMKYAHHDITITLADTANDTLSVSVADDGPGVPEDERERIFDAYYQIGNDNVAASLGTGLGLAYAKLIAVAHKGNIHVDANPGGGAVFTMTLPKGDDIEVTDTAEVIDSFDNTKSDGPADPGKTILVVEDNDDLRDMITEALSNHYTVITAIDGVMAAKILESNDIDVIVSDVMMPRMNGLELCRKVKNDINYSHIPFIILTAKTGHEAQAEGMECGADVYLEKPFPIKQLVYQIGNLLRTRELFFEHMKKNLDLPTSGTIAQVSEKSGLNKMDTEFLEKMNEIISESIANEDFSIDLLADRLNMSRSSFYRKITAITGMSPSDYLKSYRLNYAARLLADGCRVTEVADRVGFTSSSYFARCFKEKFGVLPSNYVATSKRPSENG